MIGQYNSNSTIWALGHAGDKLTFGGSSCNELQANLSLEQDTWYHIVAVYRPGENKQLYINGLLDAEAASNNTDSCTQSNR